MDINPYILVEQIISESKIKNEVKQNKNTRELKDINPKAPKILPKKIIGMTEIAKSDIPVLQVSQEISQTLSKPAIITEQIPVPVNTTADMVSKDKEKASLIMDLDTNMPTTIGDNEPTGNESYSPIVSYDAEYKAMPIDIHINNNDTTMLFETDKLILAPQELRIDEGDFISMPVSGAAINELIESEIIIKNTQETIELEIRELFQEVEQKLAELEPTKIVEVEEYFEELVTVLAEAKSFEVYEDAGEIAETVAVETGVKLTAVVAEIFTALDIEVEEEQIAYIVKLLITQKGSFSRLVEQESHELGTHEILNHISDLVSDGIKKVLEPLHRLIGRIVLSSATNPQMAKASF